MRLMMILFACGAFVACNVKEQTLKTVADYKAEATAAVASVEVQNSLELVDDDSVVFVDVREASELASNGKIAGAVHVPRGVLEFYIDPASSLYMDIFNSDKQIIFYCASGGRSILAAKTARDMGVSNVASLEGGFAAWAEAGGATQLPAAPD